jgi:UDP-glucuronate 4-epimerase
MKILVTGAAGFIGFYTCKALLNNGHDVLGIDNLNDYYSITLKKARLAQLKEDNFTFNLCDLNDQTAIDALFSNNQFDVVVNLAAQAGVRYSIENPRAYIDSNVSGFVNILEACRHNSIKNLIYASSSSVYGMNSKMPFSVRDNVDHPVSLYAATKKANELLAHTYSHLYGIPTTGLRFFTVYGPWGRPDMAYFSFTKNIIEGKVINVFNNGDMQRDFTYIDDIVEGIVRLVDQPATPNSNWDGLSPDPGTSMAPYRLYNIGNNSPVRLEDFITSIETAVGEKAKKHYMPMQMGDVQSTFADVSGLADAVGYKPATPLDQGISNFVAWYKSYYT